MTQEQASINGALLRMRREARGWVQSDVATRACMSVKQIRQLEEGGLSAFYSEAVKVTAAKKVGVLLGLSAEEVFSQGQAQVVSPSGSLSPDAALDALLSPSPEDDSQSPSESVSDVQLKDVSPAVPDDATEPKQDAPSEEKVQPAEVLADADPEPSQAVHTLQSSPTPLNASSTSSSRKNTPSLPMLLALFVGAIAVAAYFRPDPDPPTVATEPPPPLQQGLQTEVPTGKDAAGTDAGALPSTPASAADSAAPGTPAPSSTTAPTSTPTTTRAPALGAPGATAPVAAPLSAPPAPSPVPTSPPPAVQAPTPAKAN